MFFFLIRIFVIRNCEDGQVGWQNKVYRIVFVTWHGKLPMSEYFYSGKNWAWLNLKIFFGSSLRNTDNLPDLRLWQKQSSTLAPLGTKATWSRLEKLFSKVKAIDSIGHCHSFWYIHLDSVRHTFDRKKLMTWFSSQIWRFLLLSFVLWCL